MLMRWGVIAAAVVGYLMLVASPASACPDGSVPLPSDAGICIPATDPGTPDEPGHDGHTTPASQTCHRSDGTPVDCLAPWGVWNDARQCWIHQVNVPLSDPVWEGRHTDGSIWMCALIVDGVDPVVMFWVPPGAEPGLPDPGQLSRHALGLLKLETASVHTAPQSPARTYVGVENWLWVPESQWGALTKTVTAGGTSVTVTARPDRVVWEMGPETKICYAQGRAWQAGMTDDATTTCGYAYGDTSHSAPDGAFALSARIQYEVDWVCTGACTSNAGTLGLIDAPAGAGTLRVLQRQTVVVR